MMLIADKLMSQSNSKTHPTTALQSPHWQTLSLLMWVPMQISSFHILSQKLPWKNNPWINLT